MAEHHHHHHHPNVSSDLVWEITRNNNAFLVKRNSGGGSQFSRDSFNLINKHSRKHAGYLNEKAVGIKAGDKNSLILTTKKTKHSNRPAVHGNETAYAGNKSGPKIYKNIVNSTAKQGYRPDLRQHAVARASALRQSSRPVKDSPEKKLRGSKAKNATAEEKE